MNDSFTEQEYWDACLIKVWREDKTIAHAMFMFKTLTGKEAFECEPKLKRLPLETMPWAMRMRVFVENLLPKINEKLLKHTSEKDALLAYTLSDSPYDTLWSITTIH